jgi:hypothetical protein
MARNAEEAAQIELLGESAGTFFAVNFWLFFFIQFVMKSALKHIWTVFNTV